MSSVQEPPQRRSLKEQVARGLARRYRRERLFYWLGFGALAVGLAFLALFFATLIATGYTAFVQTRVLLEIEFDPEVIGPTGPRDEETLRTADSQALARAALQRIFPSVTERAEQRALYALLSPGAGLELRALVERDPSVI